MKVFWAWQSDLDQSVCRNFIRAALVDSLKQLAVELELDERPEIDHDTKDESGMPDIVDSILRKIAAAGAFVADISTVARTKKRKAVANPNVLIELGYAKRAIGTDRIIAVANGEWYKGPNDLPFDLRNRRGPIVYRLAADSDAETKRRVKAELVTALKSALRPIIERKLEIAVAAPIQISDTWYDQELARAQSGMSKTGLIAQMEIRFRLSSEIRKMQTELLNAARRSQINTFGWPIGVIIESAEHRPTVHPDGIRVEIAADSEVFRKSYDYWALRTNGDFFCSRVCLKTLELKTRSTSTPA